VAALKDVLVWSRRDGERHRLVQRVGGVVSDAPVAPSGQPFDPDLGPDGGGRVVAAYERCRKGFRRCDVYRLDLGSGKRAAGARRRELRGERVRRLGLGRPVRVRARGRAARGPVHGDPGQRPLSRFA
jgi:hypothetical protein